MASSTRRATRGTRSRSEEDEAPRRSSARGSARRPAARDASADSADSADSVDSGDSEDSPEAAPRGSSRGSSRGSGRSSRSRGDEDSGSSRRRSSGRDAAPSRRAAGRGGWDSYDETKKATTGKSTDYVSVERKLLLSDEPVLVRFVEDAPFVSYGQHWLNHLQGRRGWECIAPLPYPDMDEDTAEAYGEVGECPLCDDGEDVRAKNYFHVLVFVEDGKREEWEYRVLEAGVTLSDQLRSLNEGRQGPLSKHYWEASALNAGGGKKKGKYTPSLLPVKTRDLTEDWDLAPLTEDEVEALMVDAYDNTIVSYPTYEQLEGISRESRGR